MDSSIIETFHEKIGTLIYYSSAIINCINFKTENEKVIKTLINKVISNNKSANILIYEEQYNEAQIVLRSAIETIVLVIYLLEFPNKIDKYLIDSEIINFKNKFSIYKATKDGEINDIYNIKYSKDKLKQIHEKEFTHLSEQAKKEILNSTKLTSYTLDKDSTEKLDKFYRYNHKPFFTNLGYMFKELSDNNYKVSEDFSLRDIIYAFYDKSSQITHGCYYQWNLRTCDLEYIYHYFFKTIVFFDTAIDKAMKVEYTSEMKEYRHKMYIANVELEKLIYKKELKHIQNT